MARSLLVLRFAVNIASRLGRLGSQDRPKLRVASRRQRRQPGDRSRYPWPCKGLGLTTAAEGVEGVEGAGQLAYLVANGCTEGQGYLFSNAVMSEIEMVR